LCSPLTGLFHPKNQLKIGGGLSKRYVVSRRSASKARFGQRSQSRCAKKPAGGASLLDILDSVIEAQHRKGKPSLEIFKRRVSTRSYDPARTISDEDFNTILEFGRLSPSSVGSEPWKFLVIQNKELREKLKPIAWGMVNTLDDASHVVIIVAKKNARYDSDFLLQTLAKRNLPEDQMQMALDRYKKFQIHDMKIADDERALFEWTRKNTYIALANMLTGAAMLGRRASRPRGLRRIRCRNLWLPLTRDRPEAAQAAR